MADCTSLSDRVAELDAAIPKLRSYVSGLTARRTLTSEERTQLEVYRRRLDSYESERSDKARALAFCRQQETAAPKLPAAPSGCSLDLLNATAAQMGAYCRCLTPGLAGSALTSCVTTLQGQQRLIRDVQNSINAVLPGVSSIAGELGGLISGDIADIVEEIGNFLGTIRADLARIDAETARKAEDPLGSIVEGIIGNLNGLIGGAAIRSAG